MQSISLIDPKFQFDTGWKRWEGERNGPVVAPDNRPRHFLLQRLMAVLALRYQADCTLPRSGYYMYHLLQNQHTLHAAHTHTHTQYIDVFLLNSDYFPKHN